MSIRIPIPDQDANKLGRSIFKLCQLSQLIKGSKETQIELHFAHTKFLNAPFITGLCCLIKQWNKAGKNVLIFRGNGGLRDYLNALHFPSGLDLSTNNDLIAELASYSHKTYMPITLFPCIGQWEGQSAMDSCVNSLNDLVNAQINPSRDYWQAIAHLIEENTNNVKDHSGENSGIMSAQFYPSINSMDIVIADIGSGIFNTYAKSPKFHPKNELEALEFATTGKSTKDRAESRGFGITSSRHITVKGIEGTYIMWSGNTMFVQRPGDNGTIIPLEEGSYYQGCFLVLRLPVRNDLLVDFYEAIET